tara:strand:- start:2205 stop:2498 length:294 start_codon:yes stop_codon:yes gene_type:complete
MNNDEAMKRGARAQQLLQDPLIVESLDTIEREIIAQWEACPVRDIEGRELLWKYYQTAKKFRGILDGMVSTGKLSAFREQQSTVDKMVNIFKGKQNA